MSSVIHHTFGPHVTPAYLRWSLGYLLRPWTWQKGANQQELTSVLSQWFGGEATLFGSGREAMLALLRSCDFESGSEIIIQGYTCIALPNAIHAAGYTPVFADIDPDTLNVDPKAVSEKITHRTKAIICQHTFGMVADTPALREIADAHNLILIEDCAHTIPDVSGPDLIGKHADAIMLSFGRDKAASGILGGAAIIKNKQMNELMKIERERSKPLPYATIGRALTYPLFYAVSKPLYGIGIGKALLWMGGRIGLLIPVLTRKEKRGFQSPVVRQMPNACAGLVRKQLRKFHSLNNHRRVLNALYRKKAKECQWHIPSGLSEHFALQKFPLFVENADRIRYELKKSNIHLDDGWTGAAVCPRTVDQESAGYIPGSCPHAERVDREILTLPTHPTMSEVQAEKLAGILCSLLG